MNLFGARSDLDWLASYGSFFSIYFSASGRAKILPQTNLSPLDVSGIEVKFQTEFHRPVSI